MEDLLRSNETLKKIIDQKEKFRPQIIYTEINRDANNVPSFINHTYLLDSTNYYYCASLVKLPTSIFALEKIKALKEKGVTRNTTMFNDAIYPCQTNTHKDTSARNKLPSLTNYINKMLLVSDNNSYNRVFDFVGYKYYTDRLLSLGYPNSLITHNFETKCKGEAKNSTTSVRFLNEDLKLLYKQNATHKNSQVTPSNKNLIVGTDVYDKNKKLVSEKKDFTHSNFLPLEDIHQMLQNLIFHNYLPMSERYSITHSDWSYLVKLLGMYPKESDYPRYNSSEYYDAYKKYFIYGNSKNTIEKDSIRVFNIIGYSYGFLVDCAYIVNYNTKTEFMLSSTIYTNKRNSFGTGSYEYESVGIPFLKELSLELYRYESKRKKTQLPNLKEFQLFEKSSDTNSLKKIRINGMVTINDKPSPASIVVRSVNKVLVYYPDLSNNSLTGSFNLNLMPGEEYELEVNVNDLPPQVIDLDTRLNKANDTLNVFIEFISPHFNQMIKSKQDSVFQLMVKDFNTESYNRFITEKGNKSLSGLKYKVQIGAYKFISNFNYSTVAGMPIIIRETFDDLITRFTMGNFNTFNEADALLKKLKEHQIKDAFIFAVYEGKRFYLHELIHSGLLK